MPNDVFISYSRKNRRFVDRLTADLKTHDVRVWIDTLEIAIGDQPRRKIEEAIENCRYFCLVISKASMTSYFVRRLELEAAFHRMTKERRENFILPILWRYAPRRLTTMLATYQHLDFSHPKNYMKNLRLLVNRLKLDDERFTGERWYKAVDVTPTGNMIGIGHPLNQMAVQSPCVHVYFEDGKIRTLETYTRGKSDGAKSVQYDSTGRVKEIVLFRDNRIIDTWRYEYNEKNGFRKHKFVVPPGHRAHKRYDYNSRGERVGEFELVNDRKKTKRSPATTA